MKPRSIFAVALSLTMAFALIVGLTAATVSATPAVAPDAGMDIQLQRATFDPLVREPSLPSNLTLSSYPGDGTGYYLVQFKGPILPEWKVALQKQGAVVLDYVPQFAYIVRMNSAISAQVQGFSSVRWIGIYQPAFRLSTDLDSVTANAKPGETARIIARSFTGESTENWIRGFVPLGVKLYAVGQDSGGGTIVKMELPAASIPQVAQLSATAWVELWAEPILHNGIARSSLAMNQNGVEARLGLYGGGQILVDGDTGVSTGNTATMHDDFKGHFYKGTWGSGTCGTWADADEHGTHTAGSAVGNGVRSGAVTSTHSYSGTNAGIAPEALLWAWGFCSDWSGLPDTNPYTDYFGVMHSDDPRARVNTNSWGYGATHGTYNAFSREMDRFVWDHRDMTIFFSAGNDGTDANSDGIVDSGSMGVPAGAKNIVTVGASENYRMTGGYNPGGACSTWGNCWSGDYPANPVKDDRLSDAPSGMVAFSSRGPTLDGRLKPDVVAPGSNIVSTRYQGTSTGWGVYDAYYLYMGGTSMATPLAAGGGAIVREYYSVTRGITNPTAALVKATLINGAYNMTPGQYRDEVPDGSKDDVVRRPDINQGWGRVDLYRSLVHDAPDQLWFYEHTAGLTTGQEYVTLFTISNNQHPFRATLAWSDYPGTEAANGALVNDLDLTVIAPDGTTYNGNDIIGDGLLDGDVDHVNNVEGLDFTQLGVYTVRVRAYNTPQGPQPFALVVSGDMGGDVGTLTGTVTNASSGNPVSGASVQAQASITQTSSTSSALDGSYSMVLPLGTYTVTASAFGYQTAAVTGVSIVSGTTTTQNLALAPLPVLTVTGVLVSGGDGDGILEPGETANLSVGVGNIGFLTATNVSGVLTSTNVQATVLSGSSLYADIAPAATVTNTTLFQVKLDGGFVCGQPLQLNLTISTTQGTFPLIVNVPTTPQIQQTTYVSTDVPKSVPDNSTVGVTSLLTVTDNYVLNDVNVQLSINHTWDSDLDIYLVSPAGITVELSTDNGGSGDNYINTIFDDEAATAITAGTAPFTGSYRPEGLLSTFDGQHSVGTWKLFVKDDEAAIVGTITAWSLTLTAAPVCDVPVPLLARSGQTYSDVGGNNDGLIFPGENNLTTQIGVLNSGTLTATSVNGVLTALTPGVTVITNTASYGAIGIGALVTNSMDFGFDVAGSVACGAELTFGFTANATEGSYNTGTFSFPTGLKQTAAYTNSTSLAIPDNTTVLSTIPVPASPRTVADVKVLININHTWDSDLDIFLISPSGTRVELSTDNGSSGDNYTNTIFDDAAATSITAGIAPFTGSYRPETPLSAVDGQSISGDWKLEIHDGATGDTGTLLNWSLIIQTTKCADAPALTLNKTASASTIQPGQQLTYTLVTQSTGELDSTGVVLSDTLPADVAYVSASDSGVFSGGVVTWTIGTIPFGTSVTRTLTVQVNAGVSNGAILSNTFTALSTELPAQTSNTAAVTVVTLPSAVVEPTEVTSDQFPNQVVTKTLTISNTGTGALTYAFTEMSGGFQPAMVSKLTGNTSLMASAGRRVELQLGKSTQTAPVMAAPWRASGSINLSVDDNSLDNSVGVNSSSAAYQFIWLNRFTPSASDYPFQLEQISVIWPTGQAAVGDSIELVVYADTDGDGDPSNATYLRSYNVTVQVADSATWNDYTLTPSVLLTGPGDVLIGVIDRFVSSGSTAPNYPAGIDETSSQGRSWLGWWAADPPTPPVLPPDDTFDTLDNLGLPGNFMLRGSGSPLVDVSWLSENPITGTVQPGSSAQVDIVFTTAPTMMAGVYTATLSIDTNDTANPKITLPVTMTVLNTYTITPTAGANGSITPNTPQTVNSGASQMFTIAANTGYHISDVGVDGASIGAVSAYTFTNVTANHTITATFTSTCVPVSGVDFTYAPTAPKVGQLVTFNGLALTGTAPITYGWNFGDGSAAGNGSPITHLFPSTLTTQSYTVTLTATNACGTAPVQKSLTVQPQTILLPVMLK